MNGNGIANIIAALILAAAFVYTGGFGGRRDAGDMERAARLIGDLKTEVLVSCGCCGEGEDIVRPIREGDRSFSEPARGQ